MIQGAAFRILACFLESDEQTFSVLCKRAGYPTDLGGYYIRQLTHGDYLEKTGRGEYLITPKGKQQMALYYDRQMFAPKPRLGVLLVAKQGDSFVAQRRKVQPFVGITEWPAGTVNLGESLADAWQRIMQNRLQVDPSGIDAQFVGFFRRTDLYGDFIFDDKLFAVYTCTLPKHSEVATESRIGENILFGAPDLTTLENRSKAFADIFAFAQSGGSGYQEHTYQLDKEVFSSPEGADL